MTILAVRLVGDPVLRTPAEPVTRFDDTLAKLAADMHETMEEVAGVGLAGPQVGVSLRIFTFHVGDQRGTVCNPVVEVLGGEEVDHGSEGCLSVPGLGFPLDRPARVRVSGQGIDGERLELEAEGLLARCFQHETDHLGGTLYIDKLSGEERKRAWRAIREGGFEDNAQSVLRERSGAVGSAFGGATFGGSAFGAAAQGGAK
ncbi:MAG: peptide deformylase [Arthrobacter sp.]|nr:peptide deformylase [Arthrobacter sp.]